MAEQEVTISGKDIQSVSQKLEQFGQQLSPNEKVVVDWLLERAAAAPAESMEEADVQGYFFSPGIGSVVGTPGLQVGRAGFPAQFNRALGFGNAAGVTGEIRVGVRF